MIKIRNIDITSWVYDLDTIPIYERNLDFSQIYSDIGFKISKYCPYINQILEGDDVDIYYPDSETRIMYRGYIDTISHEGYYNIELKVNHIFMKLKDIRVLNKRANEEGVYQVNQYLLDTAYDEPSIKNVLKAIFQNIGFVNFYSFVGFDYNGNYTSDMLEGVWIGHNFEQWGQDYSYDTETSTGSYTRELDKSPTLWDVVELLQTMFHLRVRISTTTQVSVSSIGHYRKAEAGETPDRYKFATVSALISGISSISGNYIIESSTVETSGLEPYTIEYKYLDTVEHEVVERKYGISNTGESINYIDWMGLPRYADPPSGFVDMTIIPFAYRIKYDGINGFTTETAIKVYEEDELPYASIITSAYARWVYPVVYNHPSGYYPTFPQPASKYITRTIKCETYNYLEDSYPLLLAYDFKEKMFILETMDLIQDRQTYGV